MVKKRKTRRKCASVSPLFALGGLALAGSMYASSHRRCACYDEGFKAGRDSERERIKDLLFDEGDDE